MSVMLKKRGLGPQYIDLLLAIALLFFGVWAGKSHLAQMNTGRSAITSIEMLYGPAVMLATGRGFYQPDLSAAPRLHAFLRNEIDSLCPSELPEDIPETESSVAAYHRYLLYTTAVFWKFRGISWTSLEPLAALMLGLCACAIFGIMRLGMSALPAVALTLFFTLSPQMLTMLPSLRDFSKAPFLLGIIFFLGLLIKQRFRAQHPWPLALTLGMINGIAMGFRQDALIFVPPTTLMLGLVALRASPMSRIGRFLLTPCYLACFFIVASPMLGRMEGGAQPYHPLVQGFSMKRTASLGLQPGAYEFMASGSDNYTFAMLYDYERRMHGQPPSDFLFNSPGAENAGRHFLFDMGTHFPADLLTRGYGALLRTLRYTDAFPPWFFPDTTWSGICKDAHRLFYDHAYRLGPILALTALLLISARDPYMALVMLIFGLYVCGYVSLQCEFRHAFHLSFVPLWIAGFLLQRAMEGALFLLRHGIRGTIPWKASISRTLAFLLCATFITVTPLYVLRAWQHYRVAPLVAAIVDASRTEVPTERHSAWGWSLFMPDTPTATPPFEEAHSDMRDVTALTMLLYALLTSTDDGYPLWHTDTSYYLLELDSANPPPWLILLYRAETTRNNFSQLTRPQWPTAAGDTLFHAFPVYALKMPHESDASRNAFVGIGLPDTHADAFRRLYLVDGPDAFRFLPHLTWSDASQALQLHHRLHPKPDPLDAFRAEDEPVGVTNMARAATVLGRDEEAVALYRAALWLNEDISQRLAIAHALLHLGDLKVTLELLVAIATQTDLENEDRLALVNTLDYATKFCLAAGKYETATSFRGALRDIDTEHSPDLLLEEADTLYVNGDIEAARALYHSVFLASPEHMPSGSGAEAPPAQKEGAEKTAAFWRALAREYPEAPLPWFRLGLTLEMEDDIPGALNAFAKALLLVPNHCEAVLRHALLELAISDHTQAAQHMRTALDTCPHKIEWACESLVGSATDWLSRNKIGTAVALMREALALRPEREQTRLLLSELLFDTGHAEEARDMAEGLLDSDHAEQAATVLDNVFRETMPPQSRLQRWQQLHEMRPDNVAVATRLAMTLFEIGHFRESAVLYGALPTDAAESRDIVVYRDIAALAAGASDPGAALETTIRTDDPRMRELASTLLRQGVEILRDTDQQTRAVELAALLPELSPEWEDHWLLFGTLLETNDRIEEALDAYRRGLFEASTTGRVAGRVDTLLAHDRVARASFWRSAASLRSEDTTVISHLGFALEAVGEWAEAETWYRRLMDSGADSATVRLRLGIVLLALGREEEGRTTVGRELREAPELAHLASMACGQAAALLSEQGHPALAVTLHRLATEATPDDSFAWLHLGNALETLGDLRAAKDIWQHAVRMNAEAAPASMAARHLDRTAPIEERLRFWNNEVSHSNTTLARAHLCLALAAAGQLEEALNLSASLIAQYPQNTDAQFARAMLLCRTEDIENGFSLLDDALDNAPHLRHEAAELLTEIVSPHSELANTETSPLIPEKVLTLLPDNLSLHLRLGEALLRGNNPEQALRHLRHILMTVPDSPTSARLFDEAWSELNNRGEHLEDWRRIVNAHPDADTPRRHLDALLSEK